MIDKKHYVIDFNEITYNFVISVQYELDYVEKIKEIYLQLHSSIQFLLRKWRTQVLRWICFRYWRPHKNSLERCLCVYVKLMLSVLLTRKTVERVTLGKNYWNKNWDLLWNHFYQFKIAAKKIQLYIKYREDSSTLPCDLIVNIISIQIN